MELFVLSVFGGITVGVVYALAGASMVVIYRTSGYVSFAQGDIAAIALFVALAAHLAGAPYLVTAVVAVLTGALVGGLVGTFVVVPLERFGHIHAVLATIAVGLTIQGLLSWIVSAEPRAFPSAGDEVVLTVGALSITRTDAASLVIGGTVFLLLGLGFSRTTWGIAMRAVNDNSAAAQILGVKGQSLRRASWVAGGALAGLAGLFIAPVVALTPFSLNAFLIFAFCAVVVGGFESVVGALVAGVGVGVAGNLIGAYVDVNLVNAGIFTLLLAVLLIRPHGIFGRRPIERV